MYSATIGSPASPPSYISVTKATRQLTTKALTKWIFTPPNKQVIQVPFVNKLSFDRKIFSLFSCRTSEGSAAYSTGILKTMWPSYNKSAARKRYPSQFTHRSLSLQIKIRASRIIKQGITYQNPCIVGTLYNYKNATSMFKAAKNMKYFVMSATSSLL